MGFIEEEEEEYVEDKFTLSAEDIRTKIKERKSAIKESLKEFNNERITERKRYEKVNLLKHSSRKGNLNQLLFLKQ